MNNQFQLGDLAIIISDDPQYRENVGKCVEVVEFSGPGDDQEFPIRVIGGCLVEEVLGGFDQLAHLWVKPGQLMPLGTRRTDVCEPQAVVGRIQ